MRIWADVYSALDVKVGTVYTLIGATITKALDDIGSLALSTPATDETALTLLTNEARVRVYIEHDGETRELGRGIIRKKTATANSSGYTLNFDCVGSMDALNRKSVLLARTYTNQAISDIASNLISLVSDWSVGVDSGLGNQTARYDAVSVFKAILNTASNKGLHIREGLAANTTELGAFGDDSGVFAVAPGHNSIELGGNDAIVLIESIIQETDSKDVTNWIIPLGAGEGSAALTLKNAAATSYPILTMAAPDGSTLYYLSDTSSITTYGQIEKIVSFKDIAPVSNSDIAKTYAANALYDAAVQWLLRNKDPLVTYRLTVRKPRQVLRPGQKLTLTYKGYVETDNGGGELVPISVNNEQFWIMKVVERVTTDSDVLDLTVSSVDRYAQDISKIVVDAIESMQARNVGVQTFPFGFQDSSERIIQGSTFPSDPQYKTALFSLQIPDIFTDVISVKLRVLSRPLYSMTDVGPDNFSGAGLQPLSYFYAVYPSTNYPSDITLAIDGIDRTVALNGGNWNPGGGNTPMDAILDITQYIVNAAGGLYQNHTLEFAAGIKLGEGRISTAHVSAPSNNISSGIIECKILFLGTARATVPSPNS